MYTYFNNMTDKKSSRRRGAKHHRGRFHLNNLAVEL